MAQGTTGLKSLKACHWLLAGLCSLLLLCAQNLPATKSYQRGWSIAQHDGSTASVKLIAAQD